jgi:hypothetical protein
MGDVKTGKLTTKHNPVATISLISTSYSRQILRLPDVSGNSNFVGNAP